MRGASLVIGFALALGLLVTTSAGAIVDLDRATGSLEDQASEQQRTLEMLVPDPLRVSSTQALATALPGGDAPLDPDLSLLDETVSAELAVNQHANTLQPPTVDADAEDGVAIEGPTSGHGSIAPAELSQAQTELPEHLMASGTRKDGGQQAQADTHSQQQASPDAGSSMKESWDALDEKEKAAVAAGALGLLAIGPLTLYSRIRRDEALKNDTRREVYEIVEANPGVCIQEVADEAEVSYSTASYHLKRLVRMDYVTRREDGNKVLYYKNGGTFTADERELIPILQNEEAMRVFRHIVENPWCYRAQVAEALDVSHTTVNWHLDRLQAAELVEEHREGRSCHLNVDEQSLERVLTTMDKLEETATATETAKAAPAAPA